MKIKEIIIRIQKYLREVVGELKKVTWTGRRELILTTIMVIILSAILSLFVGFFDFIFSGFLRLLLH
jgi:preprotein translocase subunit SecE|uniref:Protein translocase subunit SecE n=1 Tax=candidate division WOR-3 bacterium TaxID=2052148 RepID=A0A7C3UPE2_UNCW3